MIHPSRLFAVFAILLTLGVAMPALAAPEPSPAATATPAVSTRPLPFRSVVVSVDAAARTFRMGKKVIRQVHVLPATKVMQGDGTPGAFETLATGVEVRGSLRKRADGDYDAVSVKIGPKADASVGRN
jgi:hypothetical protein